MSYGFYSTEFSWNLGCKHCLGEYEHTPQQHEQAIREDAASIKAMTAGPRLRDAVTLALPLIASNCSLIGAVANQYPKYPEIREQYNAWLTIFLELETAVKAAGSEWTPAKNNVVQMVPKGGVQ